MANKSNQNQSKETLPGVLIKLGITLIGATASGIMSGVHNSNKKERKRRTNSDKLEKTKFTEKGDE